MNKLDYIDMNLEGEGSLADIFKELGRLDTEDELEESLPSSTDNNMKATSVRLPVSLLESYDVVLKRFSLSRQDTFAYMVHDFIATSISGYIDGRVTQMVKSGVITDSLHTLVWEEYQALIESLPCDDDIKARIGSISNPRIHKIIGEI